MRYAPMCIVSFRVIAPKRLLDAQQFNLKYQSYDQVKTAPERLRWCREKRGMTRRQFAQLLHVEAGMIRRWETMQQTMTKKSWERYFARLE